MKWLAVDYGDSRTGLAGCDAGRRSPPHHAADRREKHEQGCRRYDGGLCRPRGRGLSAVCPKHGRHRGSRASKSRRFAQRLANTAGVPVVMWDERRTTVSAAAILADNDTFGAKRSGWTRSLPPSFWKAF